ncbi:MAG: glycoside hydrolase family 13 protein [Clostridia bacterium]|nr:glycoside hydrolase family 13 protein [Clostridia bacterium]
MADTEKRDKLEIRSKLCGNAELFGAFSEDDVLTFKLTVPRSFGAKDPEIRINRDGCGETVIPLEFVTVRGSDDEYSSALRCPEPGLYWYRVTYDSRFGKRAPVCDRQLTVYSAGFSTPDWIKGGVMYQIFVDRFAKGGEVKKRDDAVMIGDWDNGEPEYPEVRGGHLENNTFFGGTLYGVADKLDHLASLGVNCIYLCPIFEAYSNHKYDTGDYDKIDEMFGGEEAFDELIKKADRLKIRVVLDGVFNHTGSDSKYFNKSGRYGKGGAYRDRHSPYFSWYNFRRYPDDYESWWNIPILPRVRCDDPSYREYILGGNGIVRKYLRKGAAGWRLDVADELSDGFLDGLREAVKAEKRDAVIFGEVWEDASNKISYGSRRRYLQGGQLDGVMNYVLREAIISFMLNKDAAAFAGAVCGTYFNYPKAVSDCMMNILGTHDTARILNMLSARYPDGASNKELSEYRISAEDRENGKRLLKLAWLICATMPGVPCIYYGDEAGMEGWGDPFNRRPYPWGREDGELLKFYRRIGKFRRAHQVYREGIFKVVHASGGTLIFSRGEGGETLYTAVNLSDKTFDLPEGYKDALTGRRIGAIPAGEGKILHN